jgi:molecular chaperone GrpE
MTEKKTTNENQEIFIPVLIDENPIPASTEKEGENKALNSEMRAAEYLDRLQRLQAEFINYRKRVEREREELYQLAKGDVIRTLLPVLDDMERMANSVQNNQVPSTEGLIFIYQKLKKTLIEHGLEEMLSIGERFNPEYHEAVATEETEPEKAGLVIEEWEKGYRLGGKLLRASRVKVGQYAEKAGDL